MSLSEDIVYVGKLLDEYAVAADRMSVAARDEKSRGVPPEMQVGRIDTDGYVEWRVLPSTLTEADVFAIEDEFRVKFPPLFRAYLLARFHMFDQVFSRRYDQLILMTDVPTRLPLRELHELLTAWQPLVEAQFVPFAEWGDGWGPMCFDSAQRAPDGECPVVWLDHERIVPMGIERMRQRAEMLRWAVPLYGSCREFLEDVFRTA